MAQTRWARNGEVNIAYRALTDEGPLDLIFVSGLFSHIEVLIEEPGLRRWFDRMSRFARIVLVDRRGTGLSDPVVAPVDLEDEIADLEAVLDAIGSDRAVLQAYAAGGPLAVTFAARRPERTLALVLYATIVRTLRDEEVDWAATREEREERFAGLVAGWGTGVNLDVMAPSAANDERMRAWLGRLERQAMTPSGLQRMAAALTNIDVRPLLPHIRVPTLVLHRRDDQLIDVRHSRYLAEHIPGARYVELPGADSLPMVGDTEALLGEMEEFITGGRRTGGMERALLTVAFTDIVDATGHAARLGDSRWRDLLESHESVVRGVIEQFGGEEIKTVGDGFLLTFEGEPSKAVRCSRAIVEGVSELGIELRVGLHTGECEILGDDVGGMAVHIAARVGALAKPGEVLVSGTTYGTVVGSGLRFEDRGPHELKGVPGRWPLFALTS